MVDENEVIDIVAASGEGARIRRKDFPAWQARGFVEGTEYPKPPTKTEQPKTEQPKDPPESTSGTGDTSEEGRYFIQNPR